MSAGEFVLSEIASQPDCWQQAVDLSPSVSSALPQPGERVAAIGCGTSWFMAASYAALRESLGLGQTDAFAGSEVPLDRPYDRVLLISRSGTTTEILRLLELYRGKIPTVSVIADPDTPAPDLSDETVVLDFADERSVVQTRFATTTLALLRASLGENLDQAISDASRTITEELPTGILDRTQFTFLGHGWTVGLASEGALKMREASLSWTESYPVLEYRHGPKSITDDSSAVWFLTPETDGVEVEVAGFGGLPVLPNAEPMAELIKVQRLAVAIGLAKGLDPDNPRNLSRSVILTQD